MNTEQQNQDNMVTLKEHIKDLFDQYQKHHAREHELLAENITRAQAVAEERLDHLNKLKEQNATERLNFITRDLFDARLDGMEKVSKADHGDMVKRITDLEKALANFRGRYATIGGAITLALIGLQLLLQYVVKR